MPVQTSEESALQVTLESALRSLHTGSFSVQIGTIDKLGESVSA